LVDKHPGSVGRAPGAVRKENAALRLGTTGLNPESLLSRSAGSKKADLLITGIGQLVTMAGASGAASGPKKGKDSRDLGLISNAAVACKDGAILFAGSEDDVRSRVIPDCETEVIDAGGRAAIPGFVDAHTHLVFAGWRAEEYAMRCEGKSYLEIGAAGGGIASTVRATRDASYEHLFQRALGFLDQMLLLGTTSCEAKSGYGLDRETELKQLQVIARLGEVHPTTVVGTYLGAHSIPPEYKDCRQEYVNLVTNTLPDVRRLGLAEFVDVFCDAGAFTVEETRKILAAAKEYGFGLKIHADELQWTGATELGCELGATSCDHLLKVSPQGIKCLAEGNTVAVLLPATSCYLGEPGAPARALIDGGAAVALGTDFNPGTSTAMSMPLCMTLACSGLKMRPEEALVAATWNSAYATGLGGKVGGLIPGFQADLIILDAQDYREIPYRFGTNLVDTVIKGGRIVVRNGTVRRKVN
jgi:imidazolonepropionase